MGLLILGLIWGLGIGFPLGVTYIDWDFKRARRVAAPLPETPQKESDE